MVAQAVGCAIPDFEEECLEALSRHEPHWLTGRLVHARSSKADLNLLILLGLRGSALTPRCLSTTPMMSSQAPRTSPSWSPDCASLPASRSNWLNTTRRSPALRASGAYDQTCCTILGLVWPTPPAVYAARGHLCRGTVGASRAAVKHADERPIWLARAISGTDSVPLGSLGRVWLATRLEGG